MASVEGITGAIDAAPELVNSPGLALAASNSQDPQGTAETLAGAAQLNGAAQAVNQFQQSQPAGMSAGLATKTQQPLLLRGAGDVLNALNAPLADMQHTYRYVRDVYHRHGWFSGLLETVGMGIGAAVGAVAGGLVGNPLGGAALGVYGAGRLEGAAFFHDSWKATQSAHYMLDGHLVSPGRDLVSLLGFHADKQGNFTGWGSMLSGLADAGVDWYADPLLAAGKLRGAMRAEEGARLAVFGAKDARFALNVGHAQLSLKGLRWGYADEQALQDSGNRVAAFFARNLPGTSMANPDSIVNAYRVGSGPSAFITGYGRYRRAIDTIARITPDTSTDEQVAKARTLIANQLDSVNQGITDLGEDVPDWQTQTQQNMLEGLRDRLNALDPATVVAVGKIIGQFPELAPMAEQLAKANNAEAVMRVMREATFNSEMIGRLSRGQLPSRTLMRAGVQKVLDKVSDQDYTRAEENSALVKFTPGQQAQDNLQMVTKNNGALVPRSPGALISSGKVGLSNPLSIKYLSRKVRTFTGYSPFTPDRDSFHLGLEFDPKDPNSAQGILRTMKFGMGARTGELWSAIMLHAANTGDTALAKKVWAEARIESLKAMGLPDQPDVMDWITHKERHVSQGDFSTQQMGPGYYSGDMNSVVRTQAGSSHQALWNWQRGMLAYPDFMRAKAALRQMSAYTKVFGRLDEFAADHFTNPWFKPLALMTMGFGLRVALNEALIGTSKYGNSAYLTAMVNSRLAKYGYKEASFTAGFKDAEMNEQVQMMKAAVQAAGGWKKMVSGMIPDAKLDLALRVVAENEGHIVKGAIAAGHSGYFVPQDAPGRYSQEIHQIMQMDNGRYGFKARARNLVPNGNYRTIPHDDSTFEDQYLSQLTRVQNERSAQLIAQDLREAMRGTTGVSTDESIKNAFDYAVMRERKRVEGVDPETDRNYNPGDDPYHGERGTLSRYISQSPHEFANSRVDALMNLLVGRDQTWHDDLARKMAFPSSEGRINRGDVSAIDVSSRPEHIAGEEMDPWTGPGLWQSSLERGYKFLVDPVVNSLSRQPYFLNAVEKHYNALQGAVKAGVIDDRDALRFAQYRAMNEMLPKIHNTALRSQFGLMVRNLMPFYFAQEQAMKRAANAVLDNPSVLARWQLVSHYMSDPAWIHKDSTTGQSYAVLPGLGAFGSLLTSGLAQVGVPVLGGLPLTATGDTQSLQTVLPELRVPSASPIVSVPLEWLDKADPLMAPFTKTVLSDRGFQQNLLNTLVPNTPLRNAILFGLGNNLNMSSYTNAQLSAIASAYYHGDMPTPADYEGNGWKAQQKVDKVKNNARWLFLMKSLLSAFSPLTPNLQPDFKLQQEYYQLLKQTQNQPGVAQDEFISKHGENAIAFTVPKTVNNVGAYIPYTTDVQNFIENNLGTIQAHPMAMSYLVPQGGKTGDVQVIHDELMKLAIKQNQTPDDFLRSIYQATGERVWRASEQNYYNAKGPGPDPLLTQQWQTWQQQFRLWNPVAYNYIKDPSRPTRALYIWNDLKSVYNQGLEPDSPQAQAVGQLLQGFDQHWQQMSGLVNARAQTAYTQLSEQYHQYLVQLAQQNPELDSVIYNVFMHLDGVLTGNS